MEDKYQNTDGEIPVIRWSNRRRLAWFAFISLIVGTLIYWFALPLWFKFWILPYTWLSTIGESYSWFASGMTLTIAAYLGFNTLQGTRSKYFSPSSRRSRSYDDDDYDQEDEDEVYDPKKVK